MKHWPIALVLFAAGSPAVAQDANVRSFNILEAGIYTQNVVSSTRDANGVVHNVISNPQLTVGTNRIPAKIGVSFGFRYLIKGIPDHATVTLRTELRYPNPGARPPGSTAPLYLNKSSTDVALGAIRFAGYSFAEPWELIPGRWSISVWFGNRKLGEKEFTVVRE